MSTPDSTSGSVRGGVKTLAIRLEPDLHAQLSLIAQLRSSTITDEIRQAIEAHVAAVTGSSEFAERSEELLAEIEREATARRAAIATLLGTSPTTSKGAPGKGAAR